MTEQECGCVMAFAGFLVSAVGAVFGGVPIVLCGVGYLIAGAIIMGTSDDE